MDDVELIHMNGRVYDYNLGRFLSVDPFIQDPGNSQSMNPYSYIMNNPLAGTDPSGYSSCKEVEAKCDKPKKNKRNRARDGLTSNLGKRTNTATFVQDNGKEVNVTITTKKKVDTENIGNTKLKDIDSISSSGENFAESITLICFKGLFIPVFQGTASLVIAPANDAAVVTLSEDQCAMSIDLPFAVELALPPELATESVPPLTT